MEGSVAPIPAILALKRIFHFSLLIDEAHSFMAIGSEGRGSFNYWQDLNYQCPLAEADVMTCVFSKSVGCVGGMVLANGKFSKELEEQGQYIPRSLSSIVMLRVISLLRKPLLIRHRMKLSHCKATYVADVLAQAGCQVLSSPGCPIICFPVGEFIVSVYL